VDETRQEGLVLDLIVPQQGTAKDILFLGGNLANIPTTNNMFLY
jgi:hypothetical protein